MLVVLLHAALVYVLVTGLARRGVEIVRRPIETEIIEEPRKLPPPPPKLVLPPPPLGAPPPPPFIPPPEIRLQKPPPPPPIVTMQSTPPPAPVMIEPVPAPMPKAPPGPDLAAPPPPAARPIAMFNPVLAGVACSNYREVVSQAMYPRQARREGLTKGEVLMQFTLTADGQICDIKALSATHPAFVRASAAVVGQFKCKGQGRELLVSVPFSYRLE